MDFVSKFRNALVAGGCFVAVCVFVLALPSVYEVAASFTIQSVMLLASILLYIVTLVAHMQGYVYLGRKYDSVLMVRSTQFIMAGLVFFGIVVIAATVAEPWLTPFEVYFANAAIGFFTMLLLIPALLFAVGMVRMYKKLGIWTIVAACISPAAVIFIWKPWFVALIVAVSAYFFYRESRR